MENEIVSIEFDVQETIVCHLELIKKKKKHLECKQFAPVTCTQTYLENKKNRLILIIYK